MKERNCTIDFLKCIAILLVIFGHCIQYGSGIAYCDNQIFFDNFLFKYIYSFHMPLFAAISGYLLYSSVQKYSLKEMVFNRFYRLLIPIISWNAVANIYDITKDITKSFGGTILKTIY